MWSVCMRTHEGPRFIVSSEGHLYTQFASEQEQSPARGGHPPFPHSMQYVRPGQDSSKMVCAIPVFNATHLQNVVISQRSQIHQIASKSRAQFSRQRPPGVWRWLETEKQCDWEGRINLVSIEEACRAITSGLYQFFSPPPPVYILERLKELACSKYVLPKQASFYPTV